MTNDQIPMTNYERIMTALVTGTAAERWSAWSLVIRALFSRFVA
jgi:hypothetical protein